MSLDTQCLQFVGKPLYAMSRSGWHEYLPKPDENGFPVSGKHWFEEPFHFRLEWLFTSLTHFYVYQYLLRGGIGRIEEPGHLLEGKCVVFYTEYGGRSTSRSI